MTPKLVWTDQLKALCRKHWERGVCASEIVVILAKELDFPTTRNAVIGIMHRSGIKTPALSKRPANTLPPRKPPPDKLFRPKPAITVPLEPPAEPRGTRIGIMELKFDSCRWPYGDGNTGGILYCGERSTVIDRPYCAFHGAIAFRRHVRRWGTAS